MGPNEGWHLATKRITMPVARPKCRNRIEDREEEFPLVFSQWPPLPR